METMKQVCGKSRGDVKREGERKQRAKAAASVSVVGFGFPKTSLI